MLIWLFLVIAIGGNGIGICLILIKHGFNINWHIVRRLCLNIIPFIFYIL